MKEIAWNLFLLLNTPLAACCWPNHAPIIRMM
jgi:hypothetical protein